MIPQVLRFLREHLYSAVHEIVEADFLLRKRTSFSVKVLDCEAGDALFSLQKKLIICAGIELNRAKINTVNRLFDNDLSCFEVGNFEAVVRQAGNKDAEMTIFSYIGGLFRF